MANIGLPGVTPQNLQQHRNTIAGQKDEIFYPLYDSAVYTSGTTTQITFFSQPLGQGTTSAPGAAGPKTYADTNLTNASLLPAGNEFYCTGVEFVLYPGLNPGRGGVADSTAGNFVNDVYVLGKSGVVNLRIQNRDYILDGPIDKFPPTARIAGFAGAATNTTAAASLYSEVAYATWSGQPYHIVPIYIVSNQYFSLTITWPAAITLPSAQNARIFARLRGRLIRDAQ